MVSHWRPVAFRLRCRDTWRCADCSSQYGTGAIGSFEVTSSCLCKKAEGVAQQLLHGLQVEPVPVLHGLQVQPAPVLVESVKDGIKDSLHALQVGEQDHGPGAPADFDEATLDGVGGAQLAPKRLRERSAVRADR